jgi:hypothetical protein
MKVPLLREGALHFLGQVSAQRPAIFLAVVFGGFVFVQPFARG